MASQSCSEEKKNILIEALIQTQFHPFGIENSSEGSCLLLALCIFQSFYYFHRERLYVSFVNQTVWKQENKEKEEKFFNPTVIKTTVGKKILFL